MSKAPKLAKLHLAHSTQDALARVHQHGDIIPFTGLYSVRHSLHRLPAEVTLRKGESFPHCAACLDTVIFKLIKAAPAGSDDTAFKVVLYALPVLDDGDAGAIAV